MRPNITTIDVATGEVTTREMTDEEYEAWLIMQAEPRQEVGS